jgi:hypothetical protein
MRAHTVFSIVWDSIYCHGLHFPHIDDSQIYTFEAFVLQLQLPGAVWSHLNLYMFKTNLYTWLQISIFLLWATERQFVKWKVDVNKTVSAL